MTSESGPDRHGLTPHPPALQHPGQPSHKPHRPRHVQLVSPREHDEPNAAPQPCETQNPHGLNMDNTPQAQPPEHDDRRPASPTEATATTPPAPDASALSTAAADNASRPTTVSQAWLSRHSIHSNAIRSRLEHQRQHHDPNAATHRRAGVSHHGKSADEWRPYELQRALSKAATQLPERTKLGDQVISKVLALTRWKTKAREKAESRPVSMHARTPWLQQLQQLTRRRNGVIGSGLEHDGTDPLVAFMLQVGQEGGGARVQTWTAEPLPLRGFTGDLNCGRTVVWVGTESAPWCKGCHTAGHWCRACPHPAGTRAPPSRRRRCGYPW